MFMALLAVAAAGGGDGLGISACAMEKYNAADLLVPVRIYVTGWWF